ALSLTTTQVAMDGTGSGDGLDMSVDGSTGAHVCLNAASNGITAASTTAANAMTLATAGGIFDIQGLGHSDPVTVLTTGNMLSGSGSGQAVVATGTFTANACDQPQSQSQSI
ncbi:MAG TPA: hypothetical protein VID68_01595, partial [Solirubrobacteraceae bacterium]